MARTNLGQSEVNASFRGSRCWLVLMMNCRKNKKKKQKRTCMRFRKKSWTFVFSYLESLKFLSDTKPVQKTRYYWTNTTHLRDEVQQSLTVHPHFCRLWMEMSPGCGLPSFQSFRKKYLTEFPTHSQNNNNFPQSILIQDRTMELKLCVGIILFLYIVFSLI